MTMTVTAGTVAGTVHSVDVFTGERGGSGSAPPGAYGPGTRLVVFLAGCPLGCLYCDSPDLQSGRSGGRRFVEQILDGAHRFRRALRTGRGGLTVSGGEPLLQPEFTAALLHAAKEERLHTALDTSGALGPRASDALLDATDLVLLDIKSWHPDTYRYVTGGGEVAATLRFARRLSERGVPMWIRFVVVPGITDGMSNVDGVAGFVSLLSTVERVDVVPFHQAGSDRYAALGRRAPLHGTPEPDEALMRRVRQQFAGHGLTVR